MRKTMAIAMLAATAAFGACDDGDDPNSVEVDMAAVAGAYTALTLSSDETSGTIDWVDAGGTVTLNLLANGTTTGRLFLPGSEDDGGDFDADLTGTWELDDGEVDLDHDVDTFLRDMDFVYDDGVLTGEDEYNGATVRLVLQRM